MYGKKLEDLTLYNDLLFIKTEKKIINYLINKFKIRYFVLFFI